MARSFRSITSKTSLKLWKYFRSSVGLPREKTDEQLAYMIQFSICNSVCSRVYIHLVNISIWLKHHLCFKKIKLRTICSKNLIDIIESNKPLRQDRDTTLLRGPRPKPEAFQDNVGFHRCCGARICRRSGAGNRSCGYIKAAYLVTSGWLFVGWVFPSQCKFWNWKIVFKLKWRWCNWIKQTNQYRSNQYIIMSDGERYGRWEDSPLKKRFCMKRKMRRQLKYTWVFLGNLMVTWQKNDLSLVDFPCLCGIAKHGA